MFWPLTLSRPVWDLRAGALTILEKWEFDLGQPCQGRTQQYLALKFHQPLQPGPAILLNGRWLPDPEAIRIIAGLPEAVSYRNTDGVLLAAHLPVIPDSRASLDDLLALADALPSEIIPDQVRMLTQVTELFSWNKSEIISDFSRVAAYGAHIPITDQHSAIYGADNILALPGVKVRAAILNAEDGPIILGEGSEIQEGAILHGAHAICTRAVVNMGAKLRGDSTIGPFCKVGGEVSNSVLWGYSNKGHDGFLGNSLIGAWCNLGADTNTSNLKNNYAPVKIWNYARNRFIDTGLQFCGLIMGDHSKAGINTMFNTGTVVGVSANIFGDGFPRNFIPSFSWGGSAGFTTFKIDAAFEVAERVMARRNMPFNEAERSILSYIYQLTQPYRKEDPVS